MTNFTKTLDGQDIQIHQIHNTYGSQENRRRYLPVLKFPILTENRLIYRDSLTLQFTMPDWTEISNNLDSSDESLILKTLEDLVLDDYKIDDDELQNIIQKCLKKLDHHDIKLRSNGLAVIAKHMRDDHTGMVYVVEAIGKAIASPNLLDLKDGSNKGEVFTLLHKDLCYIIGQLHSRFPGKLMPHFKSICHYLVQAAGSKSVDVATAACEYWANLKVPYAVPPKHTEPFVKAVHPKLQKLVPYLINAMEYQKEHEEYLRSKTRDQGKSFRPQTGSKEMEQYVSRRNLAAQGFENICILFRNDTIGLFKMNLIAKLKSDNWQQVEAATLALGAFTQALGVLKEMQDVYGEVLNKVIDNYKHPNALVRAITCFTMQKFTNAKMKGVKNPFSRTLKGTLHMLNDESMEVQEMALRALATILAYSEQDLQPHAEKIMVALINADAIVYGEAARQAYYECIAHYFGKLGDTIEAEKAEELSMPLINEWSNIGWEELERSSPDNIMALCQSMIIVAQFSKLKFAAHNPVIFEKSIPFLSKLTENSSNNSLKGEPTTTLAVSFLDVICAIFQGQNSNVEKLVKRYNTDQCIMSIVLCDKFDDPVHQSAMAILGFVCESSYESIESKLPEILEVIEKMMDHKSVTVQTNALWTLARITKRVEERNDKLILFATKLGQFLTDIKGDEQIVINAALALSNIGAKWTDTMMAFFAKEEIFVHFFSLLQAEFEDESIKKTIFANITQIYTPNVKKVNPDLWGYFCVAAANCDNQDDDLNNSIKTMMKDVRAGIGNTKWSNINNKLGRSTSATLRKRYKLY